jgi:iron complex outermembrane recepter protein
MITKLNRAANWRVQLISWIVGCLFSAVLASGQTAGTGTVTGRVINPVTNDYLRNAEVRVPASNQLVTTGEGGFYRLVNVPAGAIEVVVSYAGYGTARSTVNVTPGATVSRDFELSPARGEGETITLERFVVTAEREGNAKAIMNQRNSMTVGRAVSSDIFGEVTEGNVGEFLKYLPGVDLEYVEADTRGPRIGGMDSEYVGVSIDGMKLATADAFIQYGSTENSSGGAAARSFGFEQVSINSIESIEINRVASAAMDADAPAGNINLKTKRAFDSRGRRISWNASTTLNSEEFHLHKSVGPNDGYGYKFRPNYSLNYSDVFFDNRLGVLIGISESNLYNEQYRIDHVYQRTPTAADPRPQVLTRLNFKDGPKWTERFTTTFTADYKATPDLVFSLSTTYNGYDARFYNRTANFQATTNNTNATTGREFAEGDGITTFSTGGATAGSRFVNIGGGSGIKITNSLTVVPRFEYKRGSFTLDGAFAYSRSKNDYENLVRGTAASATVGNLTGVEFTATRPAADQAEWQIVQTGGRDWADIGNFTNPGLTDDGRSARNLVTSGEANVRYVLPFRVPTFIQVGGKIRENIYRSDQLSPMLSWSFVGPGGNTQTGVNAQGFPTFTTNGTYAGYQSPFIFDMGQTGGTFRSLSGGGPPPFASRDLLAALMRTNPEYFVPRFSSENYYTARYANRRDVTETISAGYVMANTRLGRWQVQGGVRWELTEIDSREFDPLPASQVNAAGYLTNNNGRATSVEGLVYQFESRPMATRSGEYDYFHPSVTGKYRISDNLIADFGYGFSIKRPDINRITGLWSINEETERVSTPNSQLKPELSDKYVAALGYYFGAAGSLTMTLTHTSIENLTRGSDFTADEFGVTDPFFADYTFVSYTSDGPKVEFRSLELSYSQQLSFLPAFLRGTRAFASYTRTYASERRGGLRPHKLSGGVDLKYKRLTLGLKGVWEDVTPWTNTVGRYRPSIVRWDLGGSYRITDRVSVYFSGRNILEEPHRIFERIGGNRSVLWRLENYGSNWTFGVNGRF